MWQKFVMFIMNQNWLFLADLKIAKKYVLQYMQQCNLYEYLYMQYCTCTIQLNFFFLKEIIQIKIPICQSIGVVWRWLPLTDITWSFHYLKLMIIKKSWVTYHLNCSVINLGLLMDKAWTWHRMVGPGDWWASAYYRTLHSKKSCSQPIQW